MTDCTDLIIAQYRNSPRLVSLIGSFCEIIDTDIIAALDALKLQATVNTAAGFWLDLIGDRLGLPRPGVPAIVLDVFGFAGNDDTVGFDQGRFFDSNEDPLYIPVDDATYRQYLIARGGELLTNGTQPDLSRVAALAYGSASYLDNQDMTCTIILSGVVNEVVELANQVGLLPKPAGVGIKAIQVVHPEGAFGFAGQDDSTGFDQAPFTGVI